LKKTEPEQVDQWLKGALLDALELVFEEIPFHDDDHIQEELENNHERHQRIVIGEENEVPPRN